VDRHLKAALRKELQRAEDDRARLEVVITYLRERLREDDEASPEESKSPPRATHVASNGKVPRVTAADAAARVLAERGRPMKTPELLPEVQALGAKMKSTDNMFRTLVTNPRFRKVGRGLWALAEWPEESETG
jgi:hypothetical protein